MASTAKGTAKRDRRILVFAPTGRDAQLASEVLSSHGYAASVCRDAEELCREAASGAAVALIADEALSLEGRVLILRMLREQPYWSDLPVIVLARKGEEVDSLHA